MSTTLRAGLIGMGSMGANHARILSSLPGVTLVGIADPARADGPTGNSAISGGRPSGAQRTPTPPAPVVAGVDELLELGIDYAVVASPTSTHLPIGLALASAGVHALIEKPVAPNPADAQALFHAFASAGLVGAVGHIERFNSALRAARQRVMDGELGELYQVTTRRQSPFPARIADVGVIMDLATHDIDITRWLTGVDYYSVAALTAHKSGRDHEDLVACVATLQDGLVATHLVNWLTPVKERVVTITGEQGSFIIDLLTADLTYCENGVVDNEWPEMARFRGVSEGNITRFAISKPEPLRAEHEAFRDAVLGQTDAIVTLQDGLHAVLVATALQKSAVSRETVHVETAAAANAPARPSTASAEVLA